MNKERAKFICTIGKCNNTKEKLKEMYDHGMKFARFNMSYRLDYYDNIVNSIKELNKEYGVNIGLICDLAGTEMRILIEKEMPVVEGQEIVIGKDIKLDQGDLSLLSKGDEIIIKDGKIVLEVVKFKDELLYCVSKSNDILTVNANCYNKKLYDNLNFISEKDELNLNDAIKYNADYVAVSHVRNSNNINEIKEYLNNRNSKIKIMSKIENGEALENIDDIIANSDAIMIARGDLGKILPFTDIALNQKIITKKVLHAKKMLVSATDYLFSLENPTIPSRAEIVDLFTAYNDGIKYIMFTKEIAHSTDPAYLLDIATKVYNSYEKYNYLGKDEV